MICYFPLPDNAEPAAETVKSLRFQVDSFVNVHCGIVRDRRDPMRNCDIAAGRIAAMDQAVETEENYFLINNSGSYHKYHGAVAAGVDFLENNPDFGAVFPQVTFLGVPGFFLRA